MNDKGLNYQRALLFSELADLVIKSFKTLHKKSVGKSIYPALFDL